MSIVDEINGMVKIALTYDPRRLGGTMFAQRRKSPAVTTSAVYDPRRLGGTMFAQRRKSPIATMSSAAGTGQASSTPMHGFGWTDGGAGSAKTARNVAYK